MADERIDKLGIYYTHHDILKRFGLSFDEFMTMVNKNTWYDFITAHQTENRLVKVR